MKILNPNTKIIAIACDPIKRAYSELNMERQRTVFRTEEGKEVEKCKYCLSGSLEEIVREFTSTVNDRKPSEEPGFEEFVRGLKPFVEEFGKESVLLLDGERLISHPNEEWSRLLEFLGLEADSLRFYIDEEKGFPCLESPIKYCLNGAKGTSRKSDVREMYPEDTKIWKEAFSAKIKEMILFQKICDEIDKKCCRKLKKDGTLFGWTHEYACADF